MSLNDKSWVWLDSTQTPSKLPVDSQWTPIVWMESNGSPIGSVGECKVLQLIDKLNYIQAGTVRVKGIDSASWLNKNLQ